MVRTPEKCPSLMERKSRGGSAGCRQGSGPVSGRAAQPVGGHATCLRNLHTFTPFPCVYRAIT